jgi:hypothetical protein
MTIKSDQVSQVTSRMRQFEQQLTAVTKAAKTATASVAATVKAVQRVSTLLSFDEINRLTEKTSSSSGKSSSKSSSSTGRTRNKQSAQVDDPSKLADLMNPKLSELWVTACTESANQGEQMGLTLVQRIALGIKTALGNADNWVREHLLEPFQNAWDNLGIVGLGFVAQLTNTAGQLWSEFQSAWLGGSRIVQIWNVLSQNAATLWQQFTTGWGIRSIGILNKLTNAASTLWQQFSSGWGTRSVNILNKLTNAASTLWQQFSSGWGTRSVNILNKLTNAASTLWQQFSSGWGTRSVNILNKLTNSASTLWEQFRAGWAGKALGLKVLYSTDVSPVKRAVYKALGLSGWPSIQFAAQGGVFRSATLTMLGEAGTEAVVPLERNLGWMDQMAQKLSDRMGVSGNITVPVYIGGEKLAEAVVTAINARTRSTGVSPLYI